MIKKYIKKLIGKSLMVGSQNESNRLQWLESTLKEIPKNHRILDAGAGELKQKKYCDHLNYVSQDFAKYDGVGDNLGLQTKSWDNTKLDLVCDITEIPESDQSFDAIMCIEVFEHLPDPISAIKEFKRLLKPGGLLVLTAPFCSLTHFAPYHFYTGFNRYFYEKHLVENGFEIMEISTNGNFFEYLSQELKRVPICAEKYSNIKPSLYYKLIIFLSTIMLSKLSRNDSGSEELLNHGLHVLAKKK